MIRALALALVAALVALWVLIGSNRELAADLDAAEARTAAFEEAARIHSVNIQRLEMVAATAAALDRELQEGEGADAPLSDYLGRGAGRVWP